MIAESGATAPLFGTVGSGDIEGALLSPVFVTSTDGLGAVHRQLSSLLVSTTILVYALLFLMAASSPEITKPIWLAMSPIVLIGVVTQLLVWRKFRERNIAIQYVKLSWVVICGACILQAIIHFANAIQGNLLDWVLGGMLLYLAWSMYSRFGTLNNPVYRGWYSGRSDGAAPLLNLNDGEMIAACPHCSSLLAVRPNELRADDLCPNPDCAGRLVLDATLEKQSEEE